MPNIQIRGSQIQGETIEASNINLSGSFDFRAASGIQITTKAEADNSTFPATTAFVHTMVSGSAIDGFQGGNGIAIDTSTSPDTIAVDLATNPGLEFSSNKLIVKIKSETGGSITRDGDGLYIGDNAIGNAKLAGSIANAKLANSTISGVALGSNLNSLSPASNGGVLFSSYNGSAAVNNLQLDVNDLAAADINVANDFIAFYDADADATKKEAVADLITGIKGNGLSATSGVLAVSGSNATITVNADGVSVGTINNAQIGNSAAIAISKLAASTISGKSLGTNLSDLTDGNGIADFTFNGSSAASIAIDLDGSTLSVGASGLKIADDGVGSAQIADDAVGSAQIADAAVDAARLASNAVTTAKIANSAVSVPKLSFQARQDVFSPDGSTAAFNLANEVEENMKNFVMAFKNGLLQRKVASSPGNADEYTVSTSGGTTTITFGANLSASDELEVRSLA